MFMAMPNDTSPRPKLPLSQSFRAQATSDAVASLPPLARGNTDQQGSESQLPQSATALASKLEAKRQLPSLKSQPLSQENLHHRLNATGSVQAVVVDQDVLFAGLQGGDIVVCSTLLHSLSFLTWPGLVLGHIRTACQDQSPSPKCTRPQPFGRSQVAHLVWCGLDCQRLGHKLTSTSL